MLLFLINRNGQTTNSPGILMIMAEWKLFMYPRSTFGSRTLSCTISKHRRAFILQSFPSCQKFRTKTFILAATAAASVEQTKKRNEGRK